MVMPERLITEIFAVPREQPDSIVAIAIKNGVKSRKV
jgi:hypothetical protein